MFYPKIQQFVVSAIFTGTLADKNILNIPHSQTPKTKGLAFI